MRVHDVSHGGRLRRVVTPAAALRHTYLTNVLWFHSGELVGSRADLLRLGAMFRLAAVSPHSVVFLPLRENTPPEDQGTWIDVQGLADLVILRHDVPLRPSAWPEIRAKLRRGPHRSTPKTMDTPAPRPMRDSCTWDEERHTLKVAQHAGTLFMSGTSRALHEAGDELTWCGDQVARNDDIRRFGGPALLSCFVGRDYPSRSPDRRDETWECMVLARDEIFHRNRWRPTPADPLEDAAGEG